MKFLIILMLATSIVTEEAKKPNIVLIIADDLGWDDVGFHGSREAKTPYMDFLASKGVTLMDYYVNPICTPTRSALLTGRYPIRNGMQASVIMTHQRWGLGLDQKLLPQFLKELDYKTHLVGKWHLGFFAKEYTPLYRGFDTFYGCYAGRGDFWNHYSESDTMMGLDLRDGKMAVTDKEGNYSTGLFTDVAVRLIRDHDAKDPLFLTVSYQAVHSANEQDPMQAPREDITKYEDKVEDDDRRTYLGMVSAMDTGIGRIHRALKEKKIMDNTIIFFTTDNGGAVNGFDNNHGSNYPLRGMKANLFEGGVRGTAFVHSPLLSKTGSISNDLMHVTDWFSTILSLAGGNIPSYADGYNVWSSISQGKESPRPEILLNIDDVVYNNYALRHGPWKIIKEDKGEFSEWYNPPDYGRAAYSKLKGPPYFKNTTLECSLMVPPAPVDCSKPCLFNIKKDPCEMVNLAEKRPRILNKLKQRIAHYRRHMVKALYDDTDDERADPANRGGVWGPWVNLDEDKVANDDHQRDQLYQIKSGIL